jgi:hypothetical protein
LHFLYSFGGDKIAAGWRRLSNLFESTFIAVNHIVIDLVGPRNYPIDVLIFLPYAIWLSVELRECWCMGKSKDYQRVITTDHGKRFVRARLLEATNAICQEYLARKKLPQGKDRNGDDVAPDERPDSFLKREIYALGRILLGQGIEIDFTRVSGKVRSGENRRSEANENVFLGLLICTFANDNLFSRRLRSRYAAELMFAHLNDVPPGLLCGFLYQSGARKLVSGSHRE